MVPVLLLLCANGAGRVGRRGRREEPRKRTRGQRRLGETTEAEQCRQAVEEKAESGLEEEEAWGLERRRDTR
jgi:hypothetical protein